MKHATFTLFSQEYDALKARRRCALSNIFQDRAALESLLERKRCLLFSTEGCLFLFAPFHDAFHDCLYLAADLPALEDGLARARADFPAPVRVSVAGREPLAGEQARVFQAQGFELRKELLRTRLRKPAPRIIEAMRALAGDELFREISFAVPGDEEEILAMLREEFDVVGDNLPELATIREDIARRHIAVLRRGGRIASLHYFQRNRATLHALYDVTRREFRKEQMFTAVSLFVHDALEKEEGKNVRVFGWRDVSKKRLVRHAKKTEQETDGVRIYNLLYPSPAPLPEK